MADLLLFFIFTLGAIFWFTFEIAWLNRRVQRLEAITIELLAEKLDQKAE